MKSLSWLCGPTVNLTNLTIRATDHIGTMSVQGMSDTILSAGAIGTLNVSKNVTGSAQNKSLILAGYDIGPDLALRRRGRRGVRQPAPPRRATSAASASAAR